MSIFAPFGSAIRKLRHGKLILSLLVLLLSVATLRVVSTYKVLAQAQDEPAHIACGMEWIQRGTYTFEPLHPPLARVSAAVGPYLHQLRLSDVKMIFDDRRVSYDIRGAGNDILFQKNDYLTNLALARLGMLPYFVLGIIVVFRWSRFHYGNAPALLSAMLFTLTPPILAFAGLAYTDLPIAVLSTAALVALVEWLDKPTWAGSVLLGLFAALAVLAKFTALLFLSAAAVAVWSTYKIVGRPGKETGRPTPAHRTALAVLVVLIALFVLWGGYRFSVARFNDVFASPEQDLQEIHHSSHSTAVVLSKIAAVNPVVPAPGLLKGLAAGLNKNTSAPLSYLFGRLRRGGWWYFFLVDLAVKTPLPILIFFFAGAASILRSPSIRRDGLALAPLVSTAAILVVALPVKVNYGIRHILPIYPPLLVVAGLGIYRLWQVSGRMRSVARGLTAVLLLWLIATTTAIHPDYLSYFNELAGRHPETIVVWGCDLDCGQDLLSLTRVLHDRKISYVKLAVQTSTDLTKIGLPQFDLLEPHKPSTGWIAVSTRLLQTGNVEFESANYDLNSQTAYRWLEVYKPIAYVGHTIQLYYIPD
jgi:hypothetical protein